MPLSSVSGISSFATSAFSEVLLCRRNAVAGTSSAPANTRGPASILLLLLLAACRGFIAEVLTLGGIGLVMGGSLSVPELAPAHLCAGTVCVRV